MHSGDTVIERTLYINHNTLDESEVGISVCELCEVICEENTFCRECSLWLCVSCAKSHKKIPQTSKHSFSTNTEVNEKCKLQSNNKWMIIKDWKDEVQKKVNHLDKRSEKEAQELHNLQLEIKASADKYRDLIDRKEKNLLDEVAKFYNVNKETNEEQLKAVEQLENEIDIMEKYIDEIKMSTDGQRSSTLVNRLENCFSANSHKLSSVARPVSHQGSLIFDSSEANFAEFGNIGRLRKGRKPHNKTNITRFVVLICLYRPVSSRVKNTKSEVQVLINLYLYNQEQKKRNFYKIDFLIFKFIKIHLIIIKLINCGKSKDPTYF